MAKSFNFLKTVSRFSLFALFASLRLSAQETDSLQSAKTFVQLPDFSRPLRKTAFQTPHRLFKGESAGFPSRLPGLTAPLTQKYIARFSSGKGKEWLEMVIGNGEPYLAFIRREIEARGLPEELLYVPVIESAFLNRARSKAGAVGMWQFMQNSMSPFNMKITDWMDERMDFWKSTIGALDKFQENYQLLGDWNLALAAYNMGLNGVGKAIRLSGLRDYWELSEKKYLKLETTHYIPKILAVAYILSNPRKFGMDLRWADDPHWTRIEISRTVDLGILAKTAGVDEKYLLLANQELFYAVTPPDKTHYLKIPASFAEKIKASLDKKDLSLVKYYFYTVKSGDSISVLAHHYGVSVDMILQANPGIHPKTLQIGKRLIIPAYREIAAYEGGAVKKKTNAHFGDNHIVKKGESLWGIARAYGVDAESLAHANGMRLNDILREGKTIKVPIK